MGTSLLLGLNYVVFHARLVDVYLLLLVMSVLMAVWSYVDLIRDLVWHGKSQPIATRLAVCAALSLGSVSVFLGNGGWADLMVTSIYALLSFVVVVISLLPNFRSPFGMTFVDKWCLVIAVIGAATLLYTGKSGAGIAFAIGADLIAYIPTFRAARYRPQTQPVATYFIGLGAAVSALAAAYVHGSVTTDSIVTMYLVAIDTLLPTYILIRRRRVEVPPIITSFEQAS